PVLYPDSDAQRQNEWPGGVEDPRIVESDDGCYILTYTQWNRDVPRLAVATSRDLITWTKHGPAFAKVGGGKYLRTESKSGAILRRIARSDSAFIKPTESYERTGQYTAGTTFVEGLVPFQGRWYLYYGTADSRVGVAVWDPQAPADRIR